MHQITSELGKMHNFQPISYSISKMIQHCSIVTVECSQKVIWAQWYVEPCVEHVDYLWCRTPSSITYFYMLFTLRLGLDKLQLQLWLVVDLIKSLLMTLSDLWMSPQSLRTFLSEKHSIYVVHC